MNFDRQTAVGVFVLGGIVLALAAAFFFGNFNFFNPSVQAAVVFKDSIAGLSVGAPVTFRGVRVGSVERIAIQFDPKTSVAYIPVIIRLLPSRAPNAPKTRGPVDLPDLITRGLRAELNVQSFVTGQSEIDLDFDPSSPAVLHPDITTLPEIPTRQSNLQRATEQLSQLPLRELADNANVTFQNLRDISVKLDRDLPPLVTSLKATSDRSTQMVETANQAIAALQGRLDATLAAITRVADTGNQQLTQRGDDLHATLAASNQTILQIRDLLTDLKSMTSDRAAARGNIESTLRDLAAAAAALRGFSNDIEHDPQLLLTGRRP